MTSLYQSENDSRWQTNSFKRCGWHSTAKGAPSCVALQAASAWCPSCHLSCRPSGHPSFHPSFLPSFHLSRHHSGAHSWRCPWSLRPWHTVDEWGRREGATAVDQQPSMPVRPKMLQLSTIIIRDQIWDDRMWQINSSELVNLSAPKLLLRLSVPWPRTCPGLP